VEHPTSYADFGAATHPGVGGGTHRRRATFDRCWVRGGSSSCGRLWCCSCHVFMCVSCFSWKETEVRAWTRWRWCWWYVYPCDILTPRVSHETAYVCVCDLFLLKHRGTTRFGLYEIFVRSKAVLHYYIILVFPPSSALLTLLQYYCTTNAQYTTPTWPPLCMQYTIQYWQWQYRV